MCPTLTLFLLQSNLTLRASLTLRAKIALTEKDFKAKFDCAQNALQWNGVLSHLQMGVDVMGFVEEFRYGLHNL